MVKRDYIAQDKIIVLDFGQGDSHLVARQVRKVRVYSEIQPGISSPEKVLAAKPRGIILVGQPDKASLREAQATITRLLAADIPLLVLGPSLQQLVGELGARVVSFDDTERDTSLRDQDGLVHGLKMLPTLEDDPSQRVLHDFAHKVCGCRFEWTMSSFIETSIQMIRAEVGDAPVVCGLSGGVDSTVAAALVHRAIGNQLHSIFVDHGFMRKHEAEEIIEVFQERFGGNFIAVDARDRFLERVRGVSDPEEKRKRIGTEFIRVFEEEATKLGRIDYLVQGTLYSDVVESGVGEGGLVKSHHNVGGLPEDMSLKLLEPFRWLFKDEVRAVGQRLGLPDDLIWRQPFPGPGLAVRIIGEITATKLAILQEADYILRDEIRKAGLHRDIWQYFAVLTDTRTVGVHEGQRTYGHMVGIRAVHSIDGMTASWAHIPYPVLERISQRIMEEVKSVNRVVYDISCKPPATIEWE